MEKEVRMNKGSEDGSIRRRRGRGRGRIHQQNIFLPMFCRLSIKDVRLHQTKARSNVPKPATMIGSTVQLKRNKTVAGLPATATSTSAAAVARTPTGNNLQSHSRSMKKCASLVPKADTITTCTSNSSVDQVSSVGSQGCAKAVIGNMSEMDPPLPVVKRVAPPGAGGGDEVNIWRRRFNGVALKSLHIQHQISPTYRCGIINQTL